MLHRSLKIFPVIPLFKHFSINCSLAIVQFFSTCLVKIIDFLKALCTSCKEYVHYRKMNRYARSLAQNRLLEKPLHRQTLPPPPPPTRSLSRPSERSVFLISELVATQTHMLVRVVCQATFWLVCNVHTLYLNHTSF